MKKDWTEYALMTVVWLFIFVLGSLSLILLLNLLCTVLREVPSSPNHAIEKTK